MKPMLSDGLRAIVSYGVVKKKISLKRWRTQVKFKLRSKKGKIIELSQFTK